MNVPLNIVPAYPEIFLASAGLVLLIVGVLSKTNITGSLIYATILSFLTASLLLLQQDWEPELAFNGFFILDPFAGFVKILLIAGIIAVLALSINYLRNENLERFEIPILILFAGLGMMMMVSANNLLSLYIALELQSLSLYVLAAIRRNTLKSAEAGLKYFILGALSSGMLLFGSSIIYGFSGTIEFERIGAVLTEHSEATLGITMGLVFILAGLAFKISAVPFHMWTPDVYEGSPTFVTAFFAIVPKLAALALLMRLLLDPFASVAEQWIQIIWVLSAASMIVGAFAALVQDNIKRLLAYSSIGNVGYALIGLVAGTQDGAGATLYYIAIYMAMTAGTFGILLSLRRSGISLEKITTLAGLSQTHPISAYALALLMFSLSGIPPLAGFFGKLFVFQSAIQTGHVYLAVLGVVTSVVAAFYYLRIIKVMFFDDSIEILERDGDIPRTTVVFVSIAITLGLVLSPEPFLLTCQAAVASLFPA